MNYIFSGPPNSQLSIKNMSMVGNDSSKVHLDVHSAAFPIPIFLQIEKFGPPPENLTIVNYSTLVFHKVIKETAGAYNISAANYHLKNKTERIGLGTSNLILDVQCKFNFVNIHFNMY